MSNAQYKLELSPSIDTVFALNIGGRAGDVDKNEDTLSDVQTQGNTCIHVKLVLGGIINAPWSIVITVEDGADAYETVPAKIEGRIGAGGGYALDKDFALKKK